MRTLRWIFVAALTLSVAGAAWAGTACDKEKAATEKASIEKASTEKAASHCGAATQAASAGTSCGAAKMASASGGKECSAAEKAACATKHASMASAAEDCPMCCFMAAYSANKGKVTLSMVDSEDGVKVVFAAVSKDDVALAQSMATQAYAVMNMSPNCEVTKKARAESSCDGCKKGYEAFTETKVVLENTDNGAQAMVKVAKKDQIAKVHTFFTSLDTEEKVEG